MNTEVSLELAKLLREKLNYTITPKSDKVYIDDKLRKKPNAQVCLIEEMYSNVVGAPFIAEVIMGLLSKYNIWVSADTIGGEWYYSIYRHESNFETKQLAESEVNYNSPTEAYEAGIITALTFIKP